MSSGLSSVPKSWSTKGATTSNNSSAMFSMLSTKASPTMPMIRSITMVSGRLVNGSITWVFISSAALLKVSPSFFARSPNASKSEGCFPGTLSGDEACLAPPLKWCAPVLPGALSLWCIAFDLLAPAGVWSRPLTFSPVNWSMLVLKPSHACFRAALASGMDLVKSAAVSMMNFLITRWVTRISCQPKRNSSILMTHSMAALISL
mmetsp:Transcript_19997/g.59844  ORF Transcript_19997/g.59844 Transcript_19997/m.59844 type:complete len:205 (+) Transcript_19997:964-1578(+)